MDCKIKDIVLNELTAPIPLAGLALGLKSRASAYRAVKAGQIPVIKIGGRQSVPCAWLRRQLQIEPDSKAA